MYFKGLTVLLLAFLLTACSSGPTKLDANSFTLVGLVGITSPNQQQSANFKWQEQAPAFSIKFYGPIGLGEVQLQGDATSTTLTLSNGKRYSADDPEGLMNQVLGWSVPVQGLNYWMFAQRAPGAPGIVTRNGKQQVIEIQQMGWDIQYTWGARQTVPQKIILTQGNIRVTIIINQVN